MVPPLPRQPGNRVFSMSNVSEQYLLLTPQSSLRSSCELCEGAEVAWDVSRRCGPPNASLPIHCAFHPSTHAFPSLCPLLCGYSRVTKEQCYWRPTQKGRCFLRGVLGAPDVHPITCGRPTSEVIGMNRATANTTHETRRIRTKGFVQQRRLLPQHFWGGEFRMIRLTKPR